jgi:hypothetical protein
VAACLDCGYTWSFPRPSCCPLLHAVSTGNCFIICMLLDAGGPVNRSILLHVAARKGLVDVAALLLSRCADLGSKDHKGR